MDKKSIVSHKGPARIGTGLCLFITMSLAASLIPGSDGSSEIFPAGMIVRMAAQWIALLSAYYVIIHGAGNETPRIEVTKGQAICLIPVSLAAFAVYYLSSGAVAAVMHELDIDLLKTTEAPEGAFATALYILHYVVLTPILEELLFRRALFAASEGYSKLFSILMSSVFFALSHWQISRLVPVFLFSLIVGYAYAKTGSLLYTILIHSINNLLVFADLYIDKDRVPWLPWSIPSIASAAGIICLICLVAGSVPAGIDPEWCDGDGIKSFFTWPVIAALSAYLVILVMSFGG